MKIKLEQIALSYFSQSIIKKCIFSLIYGLMMTLIILIGMIYISSVEYSFLGYTLLFITGFSVIIQFLLSLSPGILDMSIMFTSRGNLIEDANKLNNNKVSIFNSLLMIHFIVFLIVLFLFVLLLRS